MPRSFDMAADYEGTVEQVHRAFSDEQYWLVRLTESGADESTLDEMVIGADGSIRVKSTQTMRSQNLPGLVTQFHRGDLSFVREEIWTPVAGGRATGAVTGSIPGAPVSLTGDLALTPAEAGSGSRLSAATSVEVRIPLVGGKIESFIGTQLVGLLYAEQRFTTEWISQNR
ncbi:MAG: DUF2505 domain-containing protein [Actinomycetota bacterium]|nr:DUF2505 domain-containing protein [Actinomycetota bacterium]